jgi:hypothetical protein
MVLMALPPPTAAPTAAPVAAPTVCAWLAHPEAATAETNNPTKIPALSIAVS